MRVNKRAIYQCDECGRDGCAREITLKQPTSAFASEFQLCDRCSEKLASMLLQRVREARRSHPPTEQTDAQ